MKSQRPKNRKIRKKPISFSVMIQKTETEISAKESTRRHWEDFWQQKAQIEEVYSNVDRIYCNLKQVTDLKHKKILEVGAGSGRDSFKLANEGATVYVLDFSLHALDIIQRLNQNNSVRVFPIQADAFYTPVSDDTFDIVFHQGLLEHFKNPLPLLKENYRILKDGGFLLVDVPQRYHIYTLIKHILIFFNKWFAGWETEFSIKQLKGLVRQAGFVVRHCYGSWMRPSFFYRVCREILKKANIRLPLYPRGFKPTRRIRDILREHLITHRWAFYTFLDIGVIGQKIVKTK
ncbi:class I SAM-dependent methyltransferase [candidate division KSB1 bacterium]|nr:MAG: class I SAM-dependent methyltransferase [candidate division KSB1 bacterium]